MSEEQIVDWVLSHLRQQEYAEAADLARQFCSERGITRTNHPEFKDFMNVSLRLAGEIALLVHK
jgi:hypothetical protein